ncbi:hypothetical protein [Halodurantibacterium flavum]|uniref:Uncharacterized protein n=1 Tax=Halodurantibacterium flavum TaxID=1382802 RepID=A0ABW4S0M7_9RHOB
MQMEAYPALRVTVSRAAARSAPSALALDWRPAVVTGRVDLVDPDVTGRKPPIKAPCRLEPDPVALGCLDDRHPDSADVLNNILPRKGRGVRKKIPSPSRGPARPIPQSEVEEDPEREEVQRVEAFSEPASGELVSAGDQVAAPPRTSSLHTSQARHEAAAGASPPDMVSLPRTRRTPTTRKTDIRVNALEGQEDALIDCGGFCPCGPRRPAPGGQELAAPICWLVSKDDI